MIFVDAHVHIYDCFDVDLLFDSALKNFQAVARQYADLEQSSTFVLMLTEGKGESWFQNVQAKFDSDTQEERKVSNRWHGVSSKKDSSLKVFVPNFPEEKIHIVAGHQLVTKEKIEVLALFCDSEIDHDLSLDETIQAVRKSDGVPVLPWGVGKWFGKREKVIESFLHDNTHDILFMGDNGGRPIFWPTPTLFNVAREIGLTVLPGTDPLPLPEEVLRVGGFGFYVTEDTPQECSPVAYLKRLLSSKEPPIIPYGCLQKSGEFFVNQIRMRLSSAA